METINWGIIGCGDVTEVKSGPAFNKVPNSKLVAVMRRNGEKAKDYAQRHHVEKWYTDAPALINDAAIDVIYIATPPASHLEYMMACIDAGKPVYVEKPMALNHQQSIQMANAAREKGIKVVVAHYRREQPLFKKVKSLIDSGAIGDIRFVNLSYYHPPLGKDELMIEKNAWRVNPSISGGGLFHDIAPHPIDLMYYFFGPATQVTGMAVNQGKQYQADDLVTGSILFENGIVFTGSWCFTASQESVTDACEIIGSEGKIVFSIFSGKSIALFKKKANETFHFNALQHVQQPMIAETVNYFLGLRPDNPCPPEEGAAVMRIIDEMTGTKLFYNPY